MKKDELSSLQEVFDLATSGYNLMNIIYKEANRIRKEQQKIEYKFISNCCKLKCGFLKVN